MGRRVPGGGQQELVEMHPGRGRRTGDSEPPDADPTGRPEGRIPHGHPRDLVDLDPDPPVADLDQDAIIGIRGERLRVGREVGRRPVLDEPQFPVTGVGPVREPVTRVPRGVVAEDDAVVGVVLDRLDVPGHAQVVLGAVGHPRGEVQRAPVSRRHRNTPDPRPRGPSCCRRSRGISGGASRSPRSRRIGPGGSRRPLRRRCRGRRPLAPFRPFPSAARRGEGRGPSRSVRPRRRERVGPSPWGWGRGCGGRPRGSRDRPGLGDDAERAAQTHKRKDRRITDGASRRRLIGPRPRRDSRAFGDSLRRARVPDGRVRRPASQDRGRSQSPLESRMGSEYKTIPIQVPSRPASDPRRGGPGPSDGMGVAPLW